jgi:hypothetical protein
MNSKNNNRVGRVILSLAQDGACTDLYKNLDMKSLKLRKKRLLAGNARCHLKKLTIGTWRQGFICLRSRTPYPTHCTGIRVSIVSKSMVVNYNDGKKVRSRGRAHHTVYIIPLNIHKQKPHTSLLKSSFFSLRIFGQYLSPQVDFEGSAFCSRIHRSFTGELKPAYSGVTRGVYHTPL